MHLSRLVIYHFSYMYSVPASHLKEYMYMYLNEKLDSPPWLWPTFCTKLVLVTGIITKT